MIPITRTKEGTISGEAIRYSILDPAGNITALVESPVPADKRKAAADALMRLHPEVEQVGFVRFPGSSSDPDLPELCMAGEEFCGNASLCTAVLYFLDHETEAGIGSVSLRLRVSGASRPVRIEVHREEDCFLACIGHPPAQSVREQEFTFGDLRGVLPVVTLEGITHLIIRSGSPFFFLRENAADAELALRTWCSMLSADGLGLIFLGEEGEGLSLTPFVWIPGSGTFFRENSCASGSAAAAIYLAGLASGPVSLTFREPGGNILAESDPGGESVRLSVRVRLCLRSVMDTGRDLY